MMRPEVVRVVPWDPAWAAQFEAERERLRHALDGVVVAVHHVGSTAVPGLAAKPILDLLLEVSDLTSLDARAGAVEALGYTAMGEYGIPGRRYFRRDDAQGVRTHHVHAFRACDEHVARHLAFRDHLMAHPAVAREYAALKLALAARHPADSRAYSGAKDAFVREHLTRALTR